MLYFFCRLGRTRSVLLQAMRLRCAVLKIPAKSSVPSGLPLNKKRSLRTHSESTLPQLLISPHFNSFRCNAYKKTGEGEGRPRPKVLQLVTSRFLFLRARTNPRNPNPLCALLHNSRIPRGVGYLRVGQPIFLAVLYRGVPRIKGHGARLTEHAPRPHQSSGTVAPQPAKCQNHASCSRHHRQETYPLWVVSNVLRADIGSAMPERRPGRKSIPERRTGIALARRPGSNVLKWHSDVDLTAGWSG
jgi:hypothetical protein